MIRFILPPIRTFSTGNQTLNRYLDSLRDGISSLSKIVNNASASVGPTGAIWWYNPGPGAFPAAEPCTTSVDPATGEELTECPTPPPPARRTGDR